MAKKAGADSCGQEVAPEQKKDVEVEVDWVRFHGISSNGKKEHPSRRKTTSSAAVVTPLYKQGQPVDRSWKDYLDPGQNFSR